MTDRAGAGLALLEALSAKMRIFRAPEFLGTAFLRAVLGNIVPDFPLINKSFNLSYSGQDL